MAGFGRVAALRLFAVPVLGAALLAPRVASAPAGSAAVGAPADTGAVADAAISTLRGEVRDSATDAPIPGAVVQLPGRDVMVVADDGGRFEIGGLRAGPYALSVQAAGYASSFDSVAVGDGRPAVVRLRPRPIVLPDVGVLLRREAYVDQLNERVKAVGRSYTILGPEQLRSSPASDVEMLVQAHTAWRVRGSHVVLNDLTVGSDQLLFRSPRDFYLVQFIPALHLLRLYTRDYLEAMVRRGWHPEPICTVC